MIQVLQFLLSLSLIVIIHEFGHFIFARIFGCRVEKFYLFFDWKFSLLRRKIGNTVYGIGWIPLGGYVKISGMVDESMDTEQLRQEPKPWEFRSKPTWQRFLIIVGGVVMNFVLAFCIYIGLAWSYGESFIHNKDVHTGYQFSQLAQDYGFRNGDKIISVGGNQVENSAMISADILLSGDRRVVVERDNRPFEITISDSMVAGLLKQGGAFIMPRTAFVVGELIGTQNINALMPGDSLTGVGGVSMDYLDEFSVALKKHPESVVTVSLVRDGATINQPVWVDSLGRVGVSLKHVNLYDVTTREYSFWQAIPRGFAMCGEQLSGYFDQLALIFSPETEAYKGVGGFITMGKIFPETWNWGAFWGITALLSIMIGVLNIMPIPALDGGHLIFIIYEMIVRRPPSQKFMEYAQMVGFFLILALVLLANGNDILKLFK